MQKTPKTAPDRLNAQALSVEEAQGLIRLAVKDALLYGQSRRELDQRVLRIIQSALAQITIPSLKNAAYRSLSAFYYRLKQLAAEIPFKVVLTFLYLTKLAEESKTHYERSPYTAKISLIEARNALDGQTPGFTPFINDNIKNYGVALQKYHRDYYRENIQPTFDKMAKEEALDPDSETYWGKRSTLRNRAEREVRYQGHIEQMQDFIDRGVKLVIVSSHADCSERCAPWQGRVYSLDGTSGTTSDGRKYVPLSDATDIYTPNGKWKNGLFGFNCRHYMVEYKPGYQFPKVSPREEARQYKITQKQRYMERQVRHWRTEAEIAKGVDKKRYEYARAKAQHYNKRYIKYSHSNNKAYYDTRTKIR